MALNSDYPPNLKLKLGPWKIAKAILLIVVAGIPLGLIAHGDIVSRRASPEFAGFGLLVLALITAFILFKSFKLDLSKPVMFMNQRGINYQPVSNLIPWEAVEKIEVHTAYRTESLHVILKKETDAVLLSELSRWNNRFGPRTIVVPLNGFDGFSPQQVKSIVYRYFRESGGNGTLK
ncbi:hypothetical protein EV130_112239 [Rhizobium azibense]|uniref:PH (Pleckstrin Homology) domain-containing protein n=1 Tax=Rhizobium azibense TaxID=1136135 RepID=A0A4R3QID7_9HYPH|nr:hypothetical protein [Rhizobium azibense]TCU20859.1 hypothetical protein EV130_112239 [Rhizobium azibense]